MTTTIPNHTGQDKIWQEVHCTKSGGGCGGYIIVGLNANLDHVASIICPKCGHKHQRSVKNGHVQEYNRHSKDPIEEICPTIAAWSETQKTKIKAHNERDGAIIRNWDVFLTVQMQELWFERFGGRK